MNKQDVLWFTKRVRNKIKRVLAKEDRFLPRKSEKSEKLLNEYKSFLKNAPDDESLEETKKRFFLSIPKSEGDIALLQRGNLYLLRRLREICLKNEINY